MRLKLYAVYDHTARIHTAPFTARNDEEATRGFAQAVNTPGHQFGLYPADFNLFYLGEFDDSTGVIEPATPSSVVNGLHVQVKKSVPAAQGELPGMQ